jgi:hypothetical protein
VLAAFCSATICAVIHGNALSELLELLVLLVLLVLLTSLLSPPPEQAPSIRASAEKMAVRLKRSVAMFILLCCVSLFYAPERIRSPLLAGRVFILFSRWMNRPMPISHAFHALA